MGKNGSDDSTYAKAIVEHRVARQRAWFQARQNINNSDIFSSNVLKREDSGDVRSRKALLEKEKALNTALNIKDSCIGRCILRDNATQERILSNYVRDVDAEKRRLRGRMEHHQRMFADIAYGRLTTPITKVRYEGVCWTPTSRPESPTHGVPVSGELLANKLTQFHLTRRMSESTRSAKEPWKVEAADPMSIERSRKMSTLTKRKLKPVAQHGNRKEPGSPYIPPVELAKSAPRNEPAFKLGKNRVLKPISSVESSDTRQNLLEREAFLLKDSIMSTSQTFEQLELSLFAGQGGLDVGKLSMVKNAPSSTAMVNYARNKLALNT